jgi:hypothetical protein
MTAAIMQNRKGEGMPMETSIFESRALFFSLSAQKKSPAADAEAF